MRALGFNITITLVVLVPFLSGCGGDSAGDPALDPMQLIENVETSVTRHHPTKYTEIEVGEFYVTLPISGTIEFYRVTFDLVVVVSKTDAAEVEQLLESQEALVRDQIIATTQRISDDKLHDPDLIWLKTELVSVLRSELKTTAIRDVVFPMMTIERG